MSTLGAFYGSSLGSFRESTLHARGLGYTLQSCSTAAILTLVGVDASAPCINTVKLGTGLACSSPYYCVSGVSTVVDGSYRADRSRGPTSNGDCEFRGEFDASVTFTRATATVTGLGTWTCGTPTTHTATRIRTFVQVNRGCVRQVWVWALTDAWAGDGIPTLAIPLSYFDGFPYTAPCYTYTGGGTYSNVVPISTPRTFDGCLAATCGRLMSGGGFLLERSG